jgi:hypothetical protein
MTLDYCRDCTNPPRAFPGRDAAFFMPLRRAGTVANAGVRYGPGSAAHRFAKSCALRRVRGTGQLSAAFTRPLALPKSIRPAYFARSAAITLPMSFMPAAPVSAIAAEIAALTSSSDICFGK